MKETEAIIKTDNVRVRIISLEPREVANWHYHTEVVDDIFCLTGTIIVRMKDPEDEITLSPAQRCQIEIGRIHQLENPENAEVTYLLVQGVGRYDFNLTND